MTKQILVVFDIDGVLVHRNAASMIEGRKADYRAGFKYVFYRPFLNILLKFLHDNNDRVRVAFWTASEEHNAIKLIDGLKLNAWDIQPLFIWNRKHCINIPGPGYQTIKDVNRIYSEFLDFNQTSVLMFDDSPLKLNRIPNGVLVDTYIPCQDTDAEDRELLRVIDKIRSYMQ